MLRWILTKWLVLAIAIALTAALFPGIEIDGGVGSLLVIAAVFAVVNAVLGPIAKLLALPLIFLTLGLFALVINALLFLFTDWLVDSLEVDGFLPALGGAVVISLVVLLLEFLIAPLMGRERR
jgi:putative membrane protein